MTATDFPENEPIAIPLPLTVGQEFDLGVQAVAALRLREVNVKEAFTLHDASGVYFRATLLACAPAGARAMAYERMPESPESPARITLACAVLARQRMMTVVQKATELGSCPDRSRFYPSGPCRPVVSRMRRR